MAGPPKDLSKHHGRTYKGDVVTMRGDSSEVKRRMVRAAKRRERQKNKKEIKREDQLG